MPGVLHSAFCLLTSALIALSLTGCGGVADRFILHPSTRVIDPRGATPRLLQWQGKQVEIYIARSPGAKATEPKAFALEFCGNGTRAEHITSYVANRWGDHPVEVWVLNYPGYGKSDGPASLKSIPPLALELYDLLKKEAGDRPIFLSGNSLGTAPALYVATQRPGVGMILQNPPPLEQIITGEHGWWNLWLLAAPVSWAIPDELDSITNANKVKIPAIFILSTEDKVVPPKYSQQVADAYAGDKTIFKLENAGHNSRITGEVEQKLRGQLDRLWEKVAMSQTGISPLPGTPGEIRGESSPRIGAVTQLAKEP